MANETRTMLVMLVVCGFLMCGCVLLPVGLGALLFYRAAEHRDLAQAQVKSAVAEQETRLQAELAKTAASAPPLAPANPPPGFPPGLAAPGFGAPNLDDIEQRKILYRLLKELRKADEQIKQLGTDDPAFAQIATVMKQQQEAALEGVCKSYGITRARLDEIMAEGDKAEW